ncbi:PHB depolymerase family esterase [Gordonia sp. PKS22-38]|uniref:PHB depolymerase family esterase n=1 Tax=Gordonia prachuapensis TaxID=3115651 RepID=A0ABU7MTD6_9ACTN|nr:PHB depolymerase family esterase [Gordonia sp. PKS22-38]
MRHKTLTLLSAAVFAFAAVGLAVVTHDEAAAAPAAGKSTERVGTGANPRTFEMYRPAGLSGPSPLVVVLHGGYGSGRQAENSYHWDAQADRGRFVAVFPDGVGRSWNAGTCCGPAQQRDVDDVAFIRAVIERAAELQPIDRSRVFVTGMSNGAMMAYRLACETDLFAAAAPVAGTLVTDCADAAPTSLLHIHGTADESVRYGGGPGRAHNIRGTARVDGAPVPQAVATFRRAGDCPEPTTRRSGETITSTAECPGGRTVQLISIVGTGHQWPGASSRPVASVLRPGDRPSQALDATTAIWDFFAEHGR